MYKQILAEQFCTLLVMVLCDTCQDWLLRVPDLECLESRLADKMRLFFIRSAPQWWSNYVFKWASQNVMVSAIRMKILNVIYDFESIFVTFGDSVFDRELNYNLEKKPIIILTNYPLQIKFVIIILLKNIRIFYLRIF